MVYEYDKDSLKNSLDVDQVCRYLEEFDAEPEIKNGIIVARTVCHNHCGCGSHKLYYYPNTGLFKCYTDCAESFDIYQLTQKVLSREHPKVRPDPAWNLPESIEYVAQYFHFAPNQKINEDLSEIEDELAIFDKYERINNIDVNTQTVELKEYDDKFLKHLPHPKITNWLKEGISQEAMDSHEICYDPKNQGIVIPHRDINNRLIGIRERTLIQEQADNYGKYMPAKIAGQSYTHPLSFNLYNLNFAKNNIQRMGKAFVFEGEKSCLKYRSYFGAENDLSVAICGSSFIPYQAWLLINLGAKEIIVALDRQYKELGDDEFKKLVKNLKGIHNKYGKYTTISFMFDKGHVLNYKSSPIDQGVDTFLNLYKRRIFLE